MNSHVVFGQHSNKHLSHYQDHGHRSQTFNLNSFSLERNKKSHEKSLQKSPNSSNKTEKNENKKESLKKQFKFMGNDVKYPKGFSPSRFTRKSPELYENKKFKHKKQMSPQNQVHETYKEEEVKHIKIVHEVFPKGKPTWLSEKGAQISKYNKNKIKNYKKSKSKEKKVPQKRNNHDFERRQHILQQNDYKILEKNVYQQKKNWKKSNDKLLPPQKSEFSRRNDSERMSISQVILEKQITQLKFELQAALEDKNILLNRVEVLNMELANSNRKLDDWKQIEMTYRNNEKILKETILALENKLTASRESKNREIISDISKFYGEGLCDRSILAKKNEEISRLNELIIMNRKKVSEAKREASDEKIHCINMLQNLQRKFKGIIQQKERQIRSLKSQIESMRLEGDMKSKRQRGNFVTSQDEKKSEVKENAIEIPLLKTDIFQKSDNHPYI